ncbi:MAG: hypothetical protein FP825_13285 [Hyphomonas sp.]|uniref:hypothetical protein n=1 Tax=Hyphomonas sp. TaxID=87 RepID=UPI0017DDFE6D|nr:hypothetical protein [Hyphomonas sp.]MBA3069439.1 hypothetical protein [Hyphomonas sp.]MBU3921997.1 hypothetical protein [Alphaproteobacteria bacterium]MBU4063821.1 hypothetical protein [Alphaproteobacteria bacterium]MBU4164218.1 hypothetical protein [Alphaproteobacteria bacterium]
MDAGIWKDRIDSTLTRVERDLGDIAAGARHYFARLDTAERMVFLGLLVIGLFYLLLRHFQRPEDGEETDGQFAGFLFVIVAVAAGFGWMVSGQTA